MQKNFTLFFGASKHYFPYTFFTWARPAISMAFAKNAASSGVAFRICTFVICVSYFFTKNSQPHFCRLLATILSFVIHNLTQYILVILILEEGFTTAVHLVATAKNSTPCLPITPTNSCAFIQPDFLRNKSSSSGRILQSHGSPTTFWSHSIKPVHRPT